MMADRIATPEEREEEVLRIRLGFHSTIYVVRVPGVEAARRMRDRGEVLVHEVDGMLALQATPKLGRPVDREGGV